MMAHELSIGFVGNPNCGKTTLFNAYTGANLKVANWPGVTVEKKEGRFQYHDHEYKLVDLPGTYSLTSYTMEEQVSRQYTYSATMWTSSSMWQTLPRWNEIFTSPFSSSNWGSQLFWL